MGTAVLFDLRDPGFDDGVIDEAVAHLNRIESIFSTYRSDSEISRIRDGRLSISETDPLVREVLGTCDRLTMETAGAFDHRSGEDLDPAGYVKGWAIEEAARILVDGGVESFLISAGGDVVARGAPLGRDEWTAGIRDPLSPDAVLGTVGLRDSAIATSGRYERGDHIWGIPGRSEELSSVSVLGPDLGIADALATAVFAAGLSNAGWLNRFPNYDLVAVTTDRRVLRSPTAPFTGATGG
jgi:thiamine biosynthesis lipoprotein